MTDEMIAVGSIPIHPGIIDYEDAHGKVILWVKDEEQGRSLYMGIEMYGEVGRVYEVRYDDWARVATDVLAGVAMHNANDPFMELLGGSV